MTLAQITAYALTKPGAYLDHPFGPDSDAVRIQTPSMPKGRIFVSPFILRGEPKVTLRCTPESARFYRSTYPDSVTRGWHCPPVQQPHFNTVSLDGSVPDAEIIGMIDHSYEVVLSKLPKRVRKELEELK